MVLKHPQDVVAIFHASFHPTRGNIVDWSLKASDDLNLDHLEYSALPSGLHLVDQDVVYFTKQAHAGVCVFTRRATLAEGHRGVHLSSLGILLAPCQRPRPWKHVSALRALAAQVYAPTAEDEAEAQLELSTAASQSRPVVENDWEPARIFFEERKVRRADLGGSGTWEGWERELESDPSHPTLHLPHLLHRLGPSALTLYKYVLGRRRILLYTKPPVEAACVLCKVAADLCWEIQGTPPGWNDDFPDPLPRGKSREGINVLGMVTLNDYSRMEEEGRSGRGWIACTTDAIFLEKPHAYDLFVDLTSVIRPTMYSSQPIFPKPRIGPSHQLSIVRFAWSDIKLWAELDRLLQPEGLPPCCSPARKESGSWPDVWRIYEDACVLCASLWSRAYPTTARNGWGAVHLDGPDTLTFIHNVGHGIEGGRSAERRLRKQSRYRSRRESSDVSFVSTTSFGGDEEEMSRGTRITISLLSVVHSYTCTQLSKLQRAVGSRTLLASKDMVIMELGVFSSADARFLEWLAQEYGEGTGQVVVCRGWKEMVGAMFWCN